jgi:ECF transporter S component (folate family)
MNKVAKKRTPTMTITYVAVLCAFCIVLKYLSNTFSISIGEQFKISITYIGWFVSGIVSGPIGAFTTAIVSDLMGQIILPTGGAPNPIFTLGNGLGALAFALCFHYLPIGKPYSVLRSFVGTIVGAIASAFVSTMGINTFGIWFLYYQSVEYGAYFITRLPQLVAVAVNTGIVVAIIPALRGLKLYWRRPDLIKK